MLDKREINSRYADGITVSLFAHFNTDVFGKTECESISCEVKDSRRGEDFTISEIPPEKALDVFCHPFAYANSMLASGKLQRVAA